MTLEEVEKPAPGDGEVLVRVRATSVNRADWHTMTGTPLVARIAFGLRAPRDVRLGTDFAGTVETVGPGVTKFGPGDHVFGGAHAAFSEYVVVGEDRGVVKKPAGVSFEEAGSVAVSGATALQALRDHGRLQPGQKVLINGASGAVGTFAVQIAKALGGDVTAVCSTRNVEMVRSLGADRVVDYMNEDFTRGGEIHDVLVDVAGSRSWSDCSRVLKPAGTFVAVGGPRGGRLLGPAGHLVRLRLASIGSRRTVANFVASIRKEDLELFRELMDAGKLRPVIDRTFTFEEIRDAMAYLGEGHARGKVAVTLPGA
jgi:NADPH:quinone reductase-like Zn-dependent oxidoreductase